MSVLRLLVRSLAAWFRFYCHLLWYGACGIDRQAEADALCEPVRAYEREREDKHR